MIEFYSPFSRKYLILTQTPQTYAEHASLTRVSRPDGSEGEATRKFCVSLRSPLDLQSKNKGREIIPTFVRVNQRREVN